MFLLSTEPGFGWGRFFWRRKHSYFHSVQPLILDSKQNEVNVFVMWLLLSTRIRMGAIFPETYIYLAERHKLLLRQRKQERDLLPSTVSDREVYRMSDCVDTALPLVEPTAPIISFTNTSAVYLYRSRSKLRNSIAHNAPTLKRENISE